jgi:gamma-tubulin complex component 2
MMNGTILMHGFTDDTISCSSFRARLYKFIEDAYSYANQTLLQLLLKDEQLLPRLRSLKRYFFLSSSSFLTHLLDLAPNELRKSSKSVSLVKLQSLLELALSGEDAQFREAVSVTMAGSGLYEWLLKVVSVSGVIGGEDAVDGAGMEMQEEPKERKDKDKEKSLMGEPTFTSPFQIID